MRRAVSIVAGACAALALVGTAGSVAWTQTADEGRTVGTWQEPAVAAPTPVAVQQPVGETSAGKKAAGEDAVGATTAGESRGGGPRDHESAIKTPEDGRQKIGELLSVDKLLGYRAPKREVFRYPGASYVKLHFSRMTMLPGDYVTVSDASGEESYRYDAPKLLDTAAPNDRWAMSITGDTAVLEVHRGGGALLSSLLGRLGVHVDQVAKGFSKQEQANTRQEEVRNPNRTGREESVCGGDESSDAVCYRPADPVAYTRSKAIARLLINGTELCTGWRIGTKNRMMTNNHCFDNSDDAYETEVWFNYQCAKCGGYDVFRPTKVWGDKVIATNHVYDYTLFTVEKFAAVRKFGFLTLDTGRPARGQELYVPQHPAGEPTRIAGRRGEKAGTCAVADNAFDGYAQDSDVSYYCDTEGGSSGSPVLSRKTDKVVALHHFGGCPNSGVRADLLYKRIKSYI
ncbi:trypsin-like peptidase [Couchioplanes caeruleus]|uniref:Glutamyl endopeptidase n=2 Tax=Couchioplanes caeruleus TaxID=56438 RepID=A0A1K0FBA6_9ACTN|nr:serine protease [Couchioplanes caeruleus]OJF10032.1 glutamyl endopeptidase [Couchioplanes caeruleus subsp. caeruleus]ROP31627.1 trypsin-like peptidase [Couchioplanes caeruleus]